MLKRHMYGRAGIELLPLAYYPSPRLAGYNVHQSCVRTELSAVNGHSLRFKYSATLRVTLTFEGHSTLFYCPSVTNTPRQIVSEISVARDNLRRLAIEPLRRDEERELEEIRTAERVGAYGWQSRVAGADSVYGRVAKAYAAREKAILDPTKLIVVDEADRLQMASLEQLRAIFDESDLGLILIGMPGLEKRSAVWRATLNFIHVSALCTSFGLSVSQKCANFYFSAGCHLI